MALPSRRDALELCGGAFATVLAGCTGDAPSGEFDDSAGAATLAITGVNMHPRDQQFYVRSTLTAIPLCRTETPACGTPAVGRRLLRAQYDLATDEVRRLAALEVDLLEKHVTVVELGASHEPFSQWPAELPASQLTVGAEAGAQHLSITDQPDFSLSPDTTRTVRVTSRIYGWEFDAE